MWEPLMNMGMCNDKQLCLLTRIYEEMIAGVQGA
jgi:hypothetical protein